MSFLTNLGMHVLNLLPPEEAHRLATAAMKEELFAPGQYIGDEPVEFLDISLPNPFGIAAGFDKYAELHDHVLEYGFAWIESGSFTYQGGDGNTRPRLFRLRDGEHAGGTLNRMGLNCLPSEDAAEILSRANRPYSFGVNIAKSHNPDIIGEKGIADVILSYSVLKTHGLYTMINISCPNTAEGKTFEADSGALRELYDELDYERSKEATTARPLGIKVSPNLTDEQLETIVGEGEARGVDLWQASNTLPYEHPHYGKGGLSGSSVKPYALDTVRRIRSLTDSPIIGCGGISTDKDAFAFAHAGANAFLVYNGFCRKSEKNPYAGLDFAHTINERFSELSQKYSVDLTAHNDGMRQ